jgi:Family of unknown function (DUF6069)
VAQSWTTGRSRPRPSSAAERIDLRRLLWAGPLTVLASLGANAVIRTVAVALSAISPAFHNLAWMHFTWVTVAAVGTAVVVFAAVAHFTDHPVRLYRRIAVVAILLSLVPDALLFFYDAPGHSPAAIATLMAMHVVDAAICIVLLPRTTIATRSGQKCVVARRRLACADDFAARGNDPHHSGRRCLGPVTRSSVLAEACNGATSRWPRIPSVPGSSRYDSQTHTQHDAAVGTFIQDVTKTVRLLLVGN